MAGGTGHWTGLRRRRDPRPLGSCSLVAGIGKGKAVGKLKLHRRVHFANRGRAYRGDPPHSILIQCLHLPGAAGFWRRLLHRSSLGRCGEALDGADGLMVSIGSSASRAALNPLGLGIELYGPLPDGFDNGFRAVHFVIRLHAATST
jgi:hypothetical protein